MADLISETDFEAALAEARAGLTEPVDGLFGPDSLMWTISREGYLFLGAGRAALLQTAHPFVATAIDQHSDVKSDPLARFRRTFLNVYNMIFGSEEEAFAAARTVRRVHNHINGTLAHDIGSWSEGAPYTAHDRDAVRWVHATLQDSAMRVHDMMAPPLSPEERDAWWQDSLRFAALFGLRRSDMPADYESFEAYVEETLRSPLLAVGPEAEEICDHLLKGKGKTPALPRWYRSLTAGLLPADLRDGYGLTFGPVDRRKAEAWVKFYRRSLGMAPARLRYAPAWYRAQSRLKGKAAPDIITRSLEKLLTG